MGNRHRTILCCCTFGAYGFEKRGWGLSWKSLIFCASHLEHGLSRGPLRLILHYSREIPFIEKFDFGKQKSSLRSFEALESLSNQQMQVMGRPSQ